MDYTSDALNRDLARIGEAFTSFADAFGRSMQAWLDQNRPLFEALGKLAEDPRVRAYMDAVERGEAPPPRRPCHCLCGRAHPGRPNVCDAEAVTARHYKTKRLGPVDVALCAPCAVAQGVLVPA